MLRKTYPRILRKIKRELNKLKLGSDLQIAMSNSRNTK